LQVGSISHKYTPNDTAVPGYERNVGKILQIGYYALPSYSMPSNCFSAYALDDTAGFTSQGDQGFPTFAVEGPYQLSSDNQVLKIQTSNPCLGNLTLNRVT
jgi:hypothetical protein